MGHDVVSIARASVRGEGFPDEAFEHLADLEDGHFWFRTRARLLVWALQTYFPRARSVLDVGCGTGAVLNAIGRARPGLRLVGVDASEAALRIAAGRADAQFVRADATCLPFKDEFDVAGSFDVLEHIDDDRAALLELAAAVRPGGGVIVTVPQHEWLWGPADEYGRHRRRYTGSTIESRVQSAGLSIIRSTSWVSMLLPVVAISRARDRQLGRDYDPTRELRLSRRANRLLETVLTLEHAAIRSGVSLPFGASRLIVARRP